MKLHFKQRQFGRVQRNFSMWIVLIRAQLGVLLVCCSFDVESPVRLTAVVVLGLEAPLPLAGTSELGAVNGLFRYNRWLV